MNVGVKAGRVERIESLQRDEINESGHCTDAGVDRMRQMHGYPAWFLVSELVAQPLWKVSIDVVLRSGRL